MYQKSLELWKHRIADRKTSGLKVTDWCEKNNLTKHAYYYWLKRIEANAQNTNTSMPIFVEIDPVYTTQKEAAKSELHIIWNDVNLTISNSGTAKLAAEFISQLQKLC